MAAIHCFIMMVIFYLLGAVENALPLMIDESELKKLEDVKVNFAQEYVSALMKPCYIPEEQQLLEHEYESSSGVLQNTPTKRPSPSPATTRFPRKRPSKVPTARPSRLPAPRSSLTPTNRPSMVVTAKPTQLPTPLPTRVPTNRPSKVTTSSPLIQGSSNTPSPLPATFTTTLNLMNSARAAVGVPALTWSWTIAAHAQTWANNCQWMHGGPGVGKLYKYAEGQNLAASYGGPVSGQGWVDEIKFFNPNNRVFSTNPTSTFCFGNWKKCGHYTQVVWRSTTLVGCGIQTCNSNSPFGVAPWNFLVCNYSPAGNMQGATVY